MEQSLWHWLTLVDCFGSEPIQKAKRWDRKEKNEVSVDMPYVVHKYNTSMGGTDRQDQNVNKYRISIRTKKWWWSLFSWRIDVTIQNAWLLLCASHRRWSLLEFSCYVVRCLLEINGRARYNQDVAIPKKDIPKELRLSEQSLQPKNPSDLHNLQSPFTCEMFLNLPHVLIFHLDLLLSNVKNTYFAFVFLFCDKKIDYDY